MKLSTRSRYGTRILVDLAYHYNQGPVRIGEISKRQDISVKYLEQLIRPLKTGYQCSRAQRRSSAGKETQGSHLG